MTGVRALADPASGLVVATVEIAATPERVFRALTSEEITQWWVRPGVFDTREWAGDLKIGGRWRAAGASPRGRYVLEGEFLEIDPPRRLAHSWKLAGTPEPESRVDYLVEPIEGGVRLTVRHSGLVDPSGRERAGTGWETSLVALARLLGEAH